MRIRFRFTYLPDYHFSIAMITLVLRTILNERKHETQTTSTAVHSHSGWLQNRQTGMPRPQLPGPQIQGVQIQLVLKFYP